MRYITLFAAILCLTLSPVAPVQAQTQSDAVTGEEEDGGFISDLLQNAMSGENRAVQVIGLEGALSARATIRQIVISDDDGVWMTINDAELDWRRAALLRGNLVINTLSAASIEVLRPPLPTEPDPELPSPVATPFQIPELPVAIDIGVLEVKSLVLGEPVIGIAAELAINGKLLLADGSLNTSLAVTRLDRSGDEIDLIAGFENETRLINLDIAINEAEGGLLAQVLKLPDRPAVGLVIKGAGPVTDFTADITLATAGTERLGGQVRLSAAGDDPDAIRFETEISGDVTPLMEARFHDFFGTETRIDLAGQTGSNNSVNLERFELTARALDLKGAARIAEGGTIASITLDGLVAAPDSDSILLPLGEPDTEIARAEIRASLDADQGDEWQLTAVVDGLRRVDLALSRVTLNAGGTLDQSNGTELIGDLDAAITGLSLGDAALRAAVGEAITLQGGFDWTNGNALSLRDFELAGQDYTARLTGNIDGLNSGLAIEGEAEIEAADISRFSGLAGRTLGGAVSVQLQGNGAPLSGAFDIRVTMGAQDLSADIAQLDPMIVGQSSLVLDAVRDETGTTLRRFELQSVALAASGDGSVQDGQAVLSLDARLDDLGRIIPQAPGEVTLVADLTQGGDTISGTARLDAPDGTFADLNGTLWQDGRVDGAYRAALNQLEKFVPSLPGSLAAEGTATRDDASNWQFSTETSGSIGLNGQFSGAHNETTGATELSFDAAFREIERLVPQISGTLSARGNAERSTNARWTARAQTNGSVGLSGDFNGTFDELSGVITLSFDAAFREIERLVPRISGTLSARGNADRSDALKWTASAETGGSTGLSGSFEGSFDETDGAADLTFDAAFQRLERFVPQLVGAISARGNASRSDLSVWDFDLQTAGSAGISGSFAGRFEEMTGIAALKYDALFARLERFVPQLEGTLAARGEAARSETRNWTATLATDGTAGIIGDFDGEFNETSGALDVFYDATLDELERLVPGIDGTLAAKGRARRFDTLDWQINAVTQGDAGLAGTFKALFDETSGDATLYFDTTLERLQRIVPDVSGDLTAAGQASLSDGVWTIDTKTTGPAGMTADIDGSFDQAANIADITATGQTRLGLANPVLQPNSIRGTADFDLALRGPPAVNSLSGTISSSGASFAIPAVAQTITNLDSNINIADGQAQIAVTGGLRAGGGFRVTGPIGLSAPFNANIAVELLDLILTDNLAITSSANGRITVNGPLTGGANIAGQINFGETEINIANASGAVGAAPIPEIIHIGESGAGRRTRARANLIDTGNGGGGGPVYGLDVTLSAPDRIFARGRGLNAELGGSINIRGTTANVVPVGQISLIRGVFDILGRRLSLDEGRVTLQGSLDPFLFFLASSSTSEGEATLTIAGPVSAPRIEVTSVPERPSEEALAMLLFGDQFNDLSPLQLAQLGAQVATLAGAGGGGFLGSVREGLGVDNLDLTTDDDGRAQVGIGAYLSDDVYTDVTINAEGESEVTLNLDLTDTLTARGSVDNQGNTGLGLFFKRDY